MTRGLNAATISALAGNAFEFATLIDINFSTPIRITDFGSNISYGGNTYVSSKLPMDMGDPTETGDLRVNEFSITISGTDNYYPQLALAENYVNTRFRMWKAVLSGGSIVGDAIQTFDGKVTNFTIEENDDDARVVFDVASHWKDFERINGRRSNENSQQKYFSTDRGMEFAKDLGRDIPWGRAL